MISIKDEGSDLLEKKWKSRIISLVVGVAFGLLVVTSAGAYLIFTAKAEPVPSTDPNRLRPTQSVTDPKTPTASGIPNDRCGELRDRMFEIDSGLVKFDTNGRRTDDDEHPRPPIEVVNFSKAPSDYLELKKCTRDYDGKPKFGIDGESSFEQRVYTGMTLQEVADAMPARPLDAPDPFGKAWHYEGRGCTLVDHGRDDYITKSCILSRVNQYRLTDHKFDVVMLSFDGDAPEAKLVSWSIMYAIPNPYFGHRRQTTDEVLRDVRHDSHMFDLGPPDIADHRNASWTFFDERNDIRESVTVTVKNLEHSSLIMIDMKDNELASPPISQGVALARASEKRKAIGSGK